MKERDVEAYLKKRVKEIPGAFTRKFSSPGRRNVPDQLIFIPNGIFWLVEVKAPGKKPTDGQFREIKRLTLAGFNVTWVNTFWMVDNFIDNLEEWSYTHVGLRMNSQ